MKTRCIAFALAAAAAVAASAAPAQAATTTTAPANAEARTFATTNGGWTSSVTTGGQAPCVVITCPTGTGDYVGTGGTGGVSDGYLRAKATGGISVASDTRVAWSSPTFVASDVDQATLSVALRSSLTQLLQVTGAGVELTTSIVDVATPANSTTVATTALTNSTAFSTLSFDVPKTAFVTGRTYRIQLKVRFTAGAAAINLAGTVALDDVSLRMVDLQPPSNLTATASTSGSIAVSGSVDPHGTQTTLVVLYGPTPSLGGVSSPITVNGSSAQSYTIPLAGLTAGATYYYAVYAVNADGNITSPEATFVVPAVPPNAAPSVIGSYSNQVRTAVYDVIAGTTAVRLEVLDSGGAVVGTFPDGDLDGTRNISLPDADGSYGVRVVRTNASGSTTSPVTPTLLDRVPPSTAGLNLQVTPTLSSSRVRTVSFNVPSDAASAEAQVLDANGSAVGAAVSALGGSASVTLGATDGAYRVKVTVRDVASNAASLVSDPVTLDQTAPASGGAPTVTGALNQRQRNVAFTRDSSTTGSAAIEVVDSGNTVVSSTTVSSGGAGTIVLPDIDGIYSVRVRQTDVVGNVSLTPSTTTTLDRDPPPASTTPTITGSLSDRARTVSFTRAPGSDTATIEVMDSTGTVVSSVGVPSGTTGGITLPDSDGTYNVRIRLADLAGNASLSPTASAILDRTAAAAGHAPVVVGSLRDRARTVRFARGGNTATATVNIKNAANAVIATQGVPGTDAQVDITLPDADGEYYVSVTQNDGVGGVTTSPDRDTTLDRVAPNPGPAPTVTGAMNVRTRSVTFVRASDAYYVSVEVVDDNGNVLSSTATPGYTTTFLLPDVDSDYRIRVRQVDLAGNSSTSATTVVDLDRVAPAAGGAPAVTGSKNLRPRHIVFDRAPDADSAAIEIFSSAHVLVSSIDVPSVSELDFQLPDMDDDFTVRVRQTDRAGNSAYTTAVPVVLLRNTDTGGGGDGGNQDPGTGNDDGTGGAGTGDNDGSSDGTNSGTGSGGGGDKTATTTSVPTEPKSTDPGGYGSLLTSCYGGPLVLTDARVAGSKVAISGLTAFAPGTGITVRDDKGHVVATAASGSTGRWAATAALPAAKDRKGTTYTATAGSTTSSTLKLTRAAVLDAVSVTGNVAQLDGHVDLTGAKKGAKLKLSVRGGRGATACAAGGKSLKLAGKAKLNKKTGAYTLRVTLPKGDGLAAVRVSVAGALKSATLYVVR